MQLFKTKVDVLKTPAIRSLFLFRTLSALQLRVVDDLLHTRRYVKDEIVFDEGEGAEALYIVVDGRVVICRQDVTDTARPVEVRPGMTFGELALLGNKPRSAQARAAQDSLLASRARSDFERLLDTHTVIACRIALQLARQLGEQLRERDPVFN